MANLLKIKTFLLPVHSCTHFANVVKNNVDYNGQTNHIHYVLIVYV